MTAGRDPVAASSLLERQELLELLDRAATKRVTVISAPPGSGKTSLLSAWAQRRTSLARVAFVSVNRDERDAPRFWSAVLDALAPETQPPPLDADELVEKVLSELAG